MSESTAETTQSNESTAPRVTSGSLDDLPAEFSWVADELSKVRNEAAERRTKLREAESQITELAEFRDKAAAAEEKSAEIELSLHRERALRTYGLEADDLEFLSDLTDPEQIDKRAARLAEKTARKTERPVDPTQGSTTGGGRSSSTADMFAAAIDGSFTR